MAGAGAIPVIGGIVGAFGANQQANATAQAASYNASVATQNAGEALYQGAVQLQQQQVRAAQQIGQGEANYGAAGVTGDSGSATDVLRMSAGNAERDALNITHASQMKAWSYQTGAYLDNMQGQNASTAAMYGAAGSMLTGAAGAVKASYD